MKWIAPDDSGTNMAIWIMVAIIVGIGASLVFTQKGGAVEEEAEESLQETEEAEEPETAESEEEVEEEDS
jgi:hypothetical protein